MRKDGWYKRKRPSGGFYPEWRKRYTNDFGKKDEFVGYTDKGLSKTAFNRELDRVKEAVHRRRLGLPSTSESPIKEIAIDYVKWGKREGGKGGRPWAKKWVQNVERYLFGTPKIKGMFDRMGVAQLDAITLLRFEKSLAGWENARTRGIVGGIVKAFLGWCERRDMLARNVLRKWPGKRMESGNKVRALNLDELEILLEKAPTDRSLAYEMVYYGGSRAAEFESFDVATLEAEGIYIKGDDTKGKKEHFFYLPAEYMARLREHVKYKLPTAKIFRLSKSHKDRYFHKDREAAGIPYKTPKGKATFHSLRHTHETYLGRAATDSATELAIGRHTDMRTRKRYLHAFEEGMKATVERMAGLRLGRNGDARALQGNGK